MSPLRTTPDRRRAIEFFRQQLDEAERQQHPSRYTAATTAWRYRRCEEAAFYEMAIEALTDH